MEETIAKMKKVLKKVNDYVVNDIFHELELLQIPEYSSDVGALLKYIFLDFYIQSRTGVVFPDQLISTEMVKNAL